MRSLALASALTTLVLAACLSGGVTGGDPLFDAGPPIGSSTGDGGAGGIEGPATWSAIYRDYFGPGSAASCSRSGTCHGATDQGGFKASGFLCPPETVADAGTTPDGDAADDGGEAGQPGDAAPGRGPGDKCYAGLIDPGAGLVTVGDTKPFDTTRLYAVLRKQVGGGVSGFMPQGSSFVFHSIDLKRLSDWYAAGAKND
jgi:hypothetical protein